MNFSLDDLVTDSQQAYLDETQPVPARTAGEFYGDSSDDDDFFGSGEDAPFELPLQPESQQINTVPDEVSAPVGETMQSARPIRTKRKLPPWVVSDYLCGGVWCGACWLVGWLDSSPPWMPSIPILPIYRKFQRISSKRSQFIVL